MFLLFLVGLNKISLSAGSGRQVFVHSVLASGAAYSTGLYWIIVPVSVFGGFPLYLAVFCPVLLGFCLGFFAALYSVFVFQAKKSFNWFQVGVFSGCAWAALEFAREYILTGFPWLIAAQSFALWPQTIQSVSLIGSFGLAMILACCALWLCMQKTGPVVWAAGVLTVVLGYGFILPENSRNHLEIEVLAVQGNIEQDLKWEEDIQLVTLHKYMDLTRQGMAQGEPDLVIWPETAIPFYFQEPTELAGKVRKFARENSLNLVTGSPAYKLDESSIGYTLFNRAYWLSEHGLIFDYYDKERLVPFGEYIPFSRFIPFMDKLVEGELDFSPGTAISPMAKGDLALGMLICYEIIFPGLVRERVRQGANILVNISNDAWFGRTSAPVQHLHLSMLRAVEQGRYVIRATNTGISAFIDPRGNVYRQTELFEDAWIMDRSGLVDKNTVYFHLHWVINILLCAGAIIALCVHTYKTRQLQK